MKIVQFLASSEWGGLENVFVDICNHMASKDSIDIYAFIFKNNLIAHRLNQNVKIEIIYSSPKRYNPFLYIELYRKIKKINPNIVHTSGSKASVIFYTLNKLIGLRYTHVATKQNPRKGRIFNRLTNVTATSQTIRKSILIDTVKMIYNGITPIEIKPSVNNDIFSMVAVGRLDKIKGFDILINECAKLDFDFRLDIIGDGEERETLENLIKSLGLETKIKLVGFQTDIPQRMQNADMVVMSSHSEGFPVTMLEAIFYAKLFISTKVGGCNEVLPKQFLIDDFQIASKIKEMHDSLNKYQNEFEDFCIANRDKFMLSNICDEYIEYYKEIASKAQK